MKKNKSFLVIVVTLVMLNLTFVSSVFFSNAYTVSSKMNSLTKEAEYYLEYYSAEKQVDALAGVNAQRAVLLESSDNFTAFIANCPPLAKIAITGGLMILTILGISLCLKVIQNNKEVYKDFFINMAQILTLAVIFVYSKVKKNSEVFQKYYRRSIIYKARKRALG